MLYISILLIVTENQITCALLLLDNPGFFFCQHIHCEEWISVRVFILPVLFVMNHFESVITFLLC